LTRCDTPLDRALTPTAIRPGRPQEAFAEHFGGPLPDVVNAEQQFTIVASELDATSDRVIEFLAESYDAPINAVFFGHFADGGHEYLARTQLLDPHQVQDKAARPSRRKLRPRNHRDFYVILGRAEPGDPPQARLRERGRRIVVLQAAARHAHNRDRRVGVRTRPSEQLVAGIAQPKN